MNSNQISYQSVCKILWKFYDVLARLPPLLSPAQVPSGKAEQTLLDSHRTDEETVCHWTIFNPICYHSPVMYLIPISALTKPFNAWDLSNWLPKDSLIMVIPSGTEKKAKFHLQKDHLKTTSGSDFPVTRRPTRRVVVAVPMSTIVSRYWAPTVSGRRPSWTSSWRQST